MIQRLKNWLIVKLGGWMAVEVDVSEISPFPFYGESWTLYYSQKYDKNGRVEIKIFKKDKLPIKPKRAQRKASTRSRKG
jgi:hypothetical protein